MPDQNADAMDRFEVERLRAQLNEAHAVNAKMDLELRETLGRLASSEGTWRCFHCGFETKDSEEAHAHFGDRDDAEEFTPFCTWWAQLCSDERTASVQGLFRELNEERDESARLSAKIEGLEYRVESQESEIASRFKGYRSINDAWCAFDSMEGRALWAEQQLRLADGVGLIAAERHRQVSIEGWTPEHDDSEHRYGDLIQAALSYAENAVCQVQGSDYPRPISWPWKFAWWKPSADPVRNLVKAGALIAAEIDRLQRAALAKEAEAKHA